MSSLPFTSQAAYRAIVRMEREQRTSKQNQRMWAMLGEVSEQLKLRGRYWTPNQWKGIFLQALGYEVEFLPMLDGDGFFPYGQSSSKLTVKQMAELLTFIAVEGNARGVTFADDPVDERQG